MKKLYWMLVAIVIYLIYSGIFIYNLNGFNNELYRENISMLQIMFYKNGEAWKYLIKSLMLIILSGIGEYFLWKFRKELDIDDAIDFIVWILLMIFIFIMVCCIIYFIQNPILRAVFILIFGGFALASSNN